MLRRLATTSLRRLIDQHELARLIGIPTHRLPRHLTLLARSGDIQVRADRQPAAWTAVRRYWLAEPTRLQGDPSAHTPTITRHSQRRRAATANVELSLADRLIVMGVDPQVAARLVATYPKGASSRSAASCPSATSKTS
jgi:hypothetical protein